MAPNNATNFTQILPVLLENGGDILVHFDSVAAFFRALEESRWCILPIFAYPEVEDKLIVLARSFGVVMFDQEAIAGRFDVIIARDMWRHEGRDRNVADMAGRVNYGDVDCVL